MRRLRELNKLNDMEILDVFDPGFREYGRVIRGFYAETLIRYMEEHTDIPGEGNIYVASDPDLEAFPAVERLRRTVFGGMPVEAGYCNGRNSNVNGFEYHKAPEINIAVSDLVLMLGHCYDISAELTYDVEMARPFYVPRGTVIELFGTTLHLSPLRTTDEGFKCVVILPRGTNTPLDPAEKAAAEAATARGDREARLLLQKNKWVIAHPNREPLIRQGAHPGVIGPNKELIYQEERAAQ